MNKRIISLYGVISMLVGMLFPFVAHTQSPDGLEQFTFKARVLEVISQETIEDEYIGTYTEQTLSVQALTGPEKGNTLTIGNSVDVVVSASQVYKTGDTVVVSGSEHIDGSVRYYIIDYARTTSLIWMLILFIVIVLIVARLKGLRALIVLIGTSAIILKVIIPFIISGYSPLLVSTLGALGILALAVYITEGVNKKSHISFLAIALSLIGVLVVSWFFVELAHLSGIAAEEALYIAGIPEVTISLKGLLLAGIIIGTLGVLDDIVISQISVVHELITQNPEAKRKSIYDAAMRVGTDHIAAIINTLFLAYAGVALPLLILFSVYDHTNLSLEYIISGELIATEIVRTIAGSIALLSAMPIATFLAVRLLVPKENTETTIDVTSHGHHH